MPAISENIAVVMLLSSIFLIVVTSVSFSLYFLDYFRSEKSDDNIPLWLAAVIFCFYLFAIFVTGSAARQFQLDTSTANSASVVFIFFSIVLYFMNKLLSKEIEHLRASQPSPYID